MENAMSRRKGKKLIIFIGIAIFIVLLIFLKMKYGIYGKNDFNNLFKEELELIHLKENIMMMLLERKNYKSIVKQIKKAITNDNKLALYKNKSAKQLVKLGVRDAVTSKPFLIINGKALYTKGNGGYGYDARTAIGQRADGVMLLLVVEANDSRTNGASMKELTKVFQDYGAINAAALDGGTSSVMVEKGLLISDPINTPFVHQTRKIATSFIVTEPSFNALTGIDGEETFEEENFDGLNE